MTTASRSRRFRHGTALTAGILAAALAGGCGEDRSLIQESDTTGSLTGTIQNYVLDFDNGTTQREHFLELGGGSTDTVRLHFDVEPRLTSGDRIRVWGTSEDDALRVTRYEIIPTPQDDLATVRSALTTVTPKTNKNAFVLVDVGGGVNVTAAMATSSVFTPGNNFANMYNVLSYGGMIYSGDVLGPFPYAMTTCDYNGLKTAVKAMITTGTYDHYMWYLGSKVSACAWSGIGAEGSAAKPATDSWYNASTGCTVLVQEVGHNNGWMHSSTLTCPGASFIDDPTGGGCTTSEYGNRYTPMGSGCGHFDAMDKWYGGYFGGCNGVKVTSSGTFNLMPIENACNGIQGIQIPMPKTTRTFKAEQGNSAEPIKNYYLEFRVPGGVDTAIKTPAVFVNVANDIGVSNRSGYHSFLLDMNQSTANTFDGMTVGQTFMDPAGGVSFTLVSADTTHASVQITIDNGTGGPTCIDGTILTAPGPVDCGSVPTTGPGGTTGTAGTTGAGGRGGATGAGRGGAGGTTGAAGRGGSGGTSAGTAGTTGAGGRGGGAGTTAAAAGTNGAAGGPGVGGGPAIGGSTGTGGSAPPTAGTSGTGTGGTISVTGAAGQTGAPGQTPSPVTGGCACSTAPDPSGAAGRAWFTLTGVGMIVALRRRRKR